MDHCKVLLCSLSKGLIGDGNSRLLGSLIVLKEKLAALSREDTPGPERVPHVLYIEEAQSFLGDFESIFAETRKYWVPVTVATQGAACCHKPARSRISAAIARLVSSPRFSSA